MLSTILVVVTFVSVIVISIIVSNTDMGTYGEVVYAETKEWEEFAILDLATTDGACPSGYDPQVSLYPGTQTICQGTLTYSYGRCKTNSKTKYIENTIEGVPQTQLQVFAGKHLCVKRSKMNYHMFTKLRTQKCESG